MKTCPKQRKLTVDIIEEVVQGLTAKIIFSTGALGFKTDDFGRNTYEIFVDCPYWLTPFQTVSLRTSTVNPLNFADYCVTEIRSDRIFVQDIDAGQDTPVISTPTVEISLTLPAPFYNHGTVIDVNDELVKIDDSTNKYPLVYVHETFRETIFHDPFSAINRESSLRMFFLSNFDRENYNTDDHYSQVIQSMNNLADEFFKTINGDSANFLRVDDERRTNHPNLSVQRNLKGQETQIFTDYLSGCESVFELSTKNSLICNC